MEQAEWTVEPWADQRTPALAIVARGDQIQPTGPQEHVVRSQSQPGKVYVVRVSRDRWTCECAHHAEVGRHCIHILSVRFAGDLKASLIAAPPERPLCPRCGKGDVVGKGRRHNASGSVPRWLCKSCGAKFTGREGFRCKRSEPRFIALALDLYFSGLSVRKVAQHLQQAHGLKVGRMTVYRWVTQYGTLAARWLDAQGARTGERWHVDETAVSIDGEQYWLWNVLDADSRLLLATHVSRTRTMDDTRAPLRKAKAVTPDRPSEVFTDGMPGYPYAVWKELGTAPNGLGNPHRRVPSIRAKESNNRVERLHGTEKDRIKVMRGFDTQAGTASIAEGFRFHYNAVRPHMALDGRTPAEAAGLPSIEGFRWLEVIKKAAKEGGSR